MIVWRSYDGGVKNERKHQCGEENYINTKNKRQHPERMEVKKYCSRCNKKTTHKEKK